MTWVASHAESNRLAADGSLPRRSLLTLKSWCRARLRPWGLLTSTFERRLAQRACIDLLRLYHQVEQELPELDGMARYAEVVARRLQADLEAARAVLQRVSGSFAEWPLARSLCLRDVVHYLAAIECLEDNPAALGLSIDLPRIVARYIPKAL